MDCLHIGLSTSPLQIKKKDSALAIAQWRRVAGDGVSLLKAISPDRQVLRSILGDDYARMLELVTGEKDATASEVLSTGVVASSYSSQANPPQSSEAGPSKAPSSRRTPPATPQKPPAKRRKVPRDDEIIDLCTP